MSLFNKGGGCCDAGCTKVPDPNVILSRLSTDNVSSEFKVSQEAGVTGFVLKMFDQAQTNAEVYVEMIYGDCDNVVYGPLVIGNGQAKMSTLTQTTLVISLEGRYRVVAPLHQPGDSMPTIVALPITK